MDPVHRQGSSFMHPTRLRDWRARQGGRVRILNLRILNLYHSSFGEIGSARGGARIKSTSDFDGVRNGRSIDLGVSQVEVGDKEEN